MVTQVKHHFDDLPLLYKCIFSSAQNEHLIFTLPQVNPMEFIGLTFFEKHRFDVFHFFRKRPKWSLAVCHHFDDIRILPKSPF